MLLRCLDAYTVNESVLGVTKRPFFHSAQDKAVDGKHQRKSFAEQSADVDELHAVEEDFDEVELEAIQAPSSTPLTRRVAPAPRYYVPRRVGAALSNVPMTIISSASTHSAWS